jgi:hypothetical protein
MLYRILEDILANNGYTLQEDNNHAISLGKHWFKQFAL